MSKTSLKTSSKMVATKSKNKVLSCSTPERRQDSPSRDSDSICDSEGASPVPFLCTQDGAEGETDVVWNFYTPKSEHVPTSRLKNSTPLSRKSKKIVKPTVIEKPLPRRRNIRASQKKTELFQDLIELNQNLNELMAKKPRLIAKEEKNQLASDEDIFSDSGDSSPKSGFRTNSRCLRRNLLSSKFSKPDTETALESDDSMNECLIKASQIVEENILSVEPTPAKRLCIEKDSKYNNGVKPGYNFQMHHDSMDAILNSIKLESPLVSKAKKCDSPRLNNDSFDSIVGNLNDSALDRLTQLPAKNSNSSKLNTSTDWTVKEVVLHDSQPSPSSKSLFGRHSSMPESPIVDNNKPSTSGMVFGRYNSMPYSHNNKNVHAGYSPTRCTQEEIKKKHQQAREKLLAKRLLPFTSTQQSSQSSSNQPTQQPIPNIPQVKKSQFQPKVASSSIQRSNNSLPNPQMSKDMSKTNPQQNKSASVDLKSQFTKSLIEQKRQEALMKLRRRQQQRP